jgi:protein TonB
MLRSTVTCLPAMRNRWAASIKIGVVSLHDAGQHGRIMIRTTKSVLRFEGRRSRRRPTAPHRRFVLIAAGLSIALHLAAALLVVYLPRVLPREPRPQQQGTVELLMVERKGAEPNEAAKPQESPPQDSQPAPPQPKQAAAPQPEAEKPDVQAAASPPTPAPPVTKSTDEAGPPPTEVSPAKEAKADPRPEAQQPAPSPAPPQTHDAPVFDLAGTESESNAEVLGGRVLPASPDNRFRNRPPIYPDEAAIHGEHGSVLLIIHVSDAGLPTGVDVVESSGVASLDQAATAAVRKWRFRPALQEGRAIPFDMPFRVVFEAD